MITEVKDLIKIVRWYLKLSEKDRRVARGFLMSMALR